VRRVPTLLLILLAWTAGLGSTAGAAPAPEPAIRQVLRWANDAEGGAPYIFHPPDNPDQLVGFEVELAQALCDRLGYTSQFVQYNWANLIPGLRQGGNYDIIIAALERTPENLAQVAMSRPYFTFGQQLVARTQDTNIQSLKDLAGRRIGVLASTLSHRLATQQGSVEVRVYDENVNYFRDLELGRIDAVLTDSPIATVQLKNRPNLRTAGPPFAHAHYAIAVPIGSPELLIRINEALGSLIQDGTLERIDRRYELWDPQQAALATWTAEAVPTTTSGAATAATKPAPVPMLRYFKILLEAAVTTLWVSLTSMALAMSWGLGLALARRHGPKPLRWMATLYIEVFRGTPLLLQLYFIYFGLAQQWGWKLSAGAAAVLTLGLNYAANEAENFRAGLEAIPRGQTEAALALGLSPAQTLRRILLPQALRISLPGITNDLIALFKDSSIVSVIGLVELTKEFLIRSLDAGDYIGLGILTAAIYLAMGHAASRGARALERRLQT
jgi:polar amino acid transport system substrate-binding protein